MIDPKKRILGLQTTLKTTVHFDGTGLHSGAPARMSVVPQPADTGIWFRRTDLADDQNADIAARWDMVRESRLCTLIANEAGVTISTIEHIMAALAGCGIHNARVEIDGPEVPILDGSSAQFVKAFLDCGFVKQNTPVTAVEVLRPVEVRDGQAVARLEPAENLWIDFSIDFADEAIGSQAKTLNLANGAFVRELCDSRTFCRRADVDAMRSAGLALGGTYDNAVVVDGAAVLSPGGLRHPDEAVRHKMLDALGDLALAGGPVMGRYTGIRAGHAMTNRLLRALMADPSNYRFVSCDPKLSRNMPGEGLLASDAPKESFPS